MDGLPNHNITPPKSGWYKHVWITIDPNKTKTLMVVDTGKGFISNVRFICSVVQDLYFVKKGFPFISWWYFSMYRSSDRACQPSPPPPLPHPINCITLLYLYVCIPHFLYNYMIILHGCTRFSFLNRPVKMKTFVFMLKRVNFWYMQCICKPQAN